MYTANKDGTITKTAAPRTFESWINTSYLSKPSRALLEKFRDELAGYLAEGRMKDQPVATLRKLTRRMEKRGIIERVPCHRCSGTGKYSWNEKWGRTCMKCEGHGAAYPSSSAILKVLRDPQKLTLALGA